MFYCLDYKNNNENIWNKIEYGTVRLNFVPSNFGGKE
jgi:hypothetical protein